MTTLRCPICHRTSWLTSDGLAEHMTRDHTHRGVALALVELLPCGKQSYATEHDAAAALVSTWAARGPRRLERRTYHCTRCRAWHLTSKPERTST